MMSYIDLINNFWRLDFEKRFSLIQTRYYFLLLNYANNRHWKEAISLSNTRLKQEVVCSETGLKEARMQLVKRRMIGYKKGYKNLSGKYFIKYKPGIYLAPSYSPSDKDNRSIFNKNFDVNSGEHNGEHSGNHSGNYSGEHRGEHSSKYSENTVSYIREEKIREEKKMKKNGKELEKEQKDLLHPHHHLHLKIINLYNKTCKNLPAFDALSVGLIENLIEKRNKYLKNTEGWTNFFNKVH